jgi:hypothetical protein
MLGSIYYQSVTCLLQSLICSIEELLFLKKIVFRVCKKAVENRPALCQVLARADDFLSDLAMCLAVWGGYFLPLFNDSTLLE